MLAKTFPRENALWRPLFPMQQQGWRKTIHPKFCLRDKLTRLFYQEGKRKGDFSHQGAMIKDAEFSSGIVTHIYFMWVWEELEANGILHCSPGRHLKPNSCFNFACYLLSRCCVCESPVRHLPSCGRSTVKEGWELYLWGRWKMEVWRNRNKSRWGHEVKGTIEKHKNQCTILD